MFYARSRTKLSVPSTIKVRAISYTPDTRLIRLTAGTQTQDFSLKADVNRLSEVVVTGVVGEAVERSKVPFAIGRLTLPLFVFCLLDGLVPQTVFVGALAALLFRGLLRPEVRAYLSEE